MVGCSEHRWWSAVVFTAGDCIQSTIIHEAPNSCLLDCASNAAALVCCYPGRDGFTCKKLNLSLHMTSNLLYRIMTEEGQVRASANHTRLRLTAHLQVFLLQMLNMPTSPVGWNISFTVNDNHVTQPCDSERKLLQMGWRFRLLFCFSMNSLRSPLLCFHVDSVCGFHLFSGVSFHHCTQKPDWNKSELVSHPQHVTVHILKPSLTLAPLTSAVPPALELLLLPLCSDLLYLFHPQVHHLRAPLVRVWPLIWNKVQINSFELI